MFCMRKFTLGMFQQSVPNFVRNLSEMREKVSEINVRNKTSEFLASEFFGSNVAFIKPLYTLTHVRHVKHDYMNDGNYV